VETFPPFYVFVCLDGGDSLKGCYGIAVAITFRTRCPKVTSTVSEW